MPGEIRVRYTFAELKIPKIIIGAYIVRCAHENNYNNKNNNNDNDNDNI